MTESASKPWTIGFQVHSVLCRTTFCLSSYVTYLHGTSRVALVVKINAPANAGDIEMWVRSLGQEDPLEEGMATHSSILTWKILWTEEPAGTVHSVTKSRTLLK